MFSFLKKRQSQSIKVNVITREPFKLRLAEWQADEKLTHGMMVLMNGDLAKLALQCLINEHPAFYSLPVDASIESRAAYQAKCEGYSMAIANLEAMSQKRKIVELDQPTFEEPETVNQ